MSNQKVQIVFKGEVADGILANQNHFSMCSQVVELARKSASHMERIDIKRAWSVTEIESVVKCIENTLNDSTKYPNKSGSEFESLQRFLNHLVEQTEKQLNLKITYNKSLNQIGAKDAPPG